MKKVAKKAINPPDPVLLQMGMNKAREFMFKHMSSEDRARRLLRQALTQVAPQ